MTWPDIASVRGATQPSLYLAKAVCKPWTHQLNQLKRIPLQDIPPHDDPECAAPIVSPYVNDSVHMIDIVRAISIICVSQLGSKHRAEL